MRQKFQVQNITRKARPKDGPDTRTMIQKRGHYVSYRNDQDKVVMLRPDEMKIVSEPNENILTLVSQGYLSCIPLKDITEALQGHKAPTRRRKADHDAEVADAVSSATAQGRRAQGRASMMGETQETKGVTELERPRPKGVVELEGAVNPDGNPNHVVVATRDSIPKRQRSR